MRVLATGRSSVLVWRHCNTLCTSGFVDDVDLYTMVRHRRRKQGVHSKQVVRWQHGFDTAAFTKNWLTMGSTDPRAKSDVYDRVGVAGNVTSAFNSRVKRHGVNPHLSDKVDQWRRGHLRSPDRSNEVPHFSGEGHTRPKSN